MVDKIMVDKKDCNCFECGAPLTFKSKGEEEAYSASGLCESCRMEALKESHELLVVYQLERIANALDRITEQIIPKQEKKED